VAVPAAADPAAAGVAVAAPARAGGPVAVAAARWAARSVAADPARRRAPHWWALPVEVDADPLALCEVLRAVTSARSS